MRILTYLRCAAALLLPVAVPAQGLAQEFKGVNLAGAAYSSNKIPGRYGYDYVFPKPGEVTYFREKGMNIFRISVLWERLQPVRQGNLDPAYLGRLRDFIAEANQSGAKVIVDVHDYGRYRGVPIGTDPVTSGDFRDFWARMATAFGGNSGVMFGLMNEPQLHSADAWRDIQQQAILGIRGTGAKNPILVSGISWDAAHNFATVNGQALKSLQDPAHALLYEVHEYFDADSSGRSPDCIPASQVIGRLAPFTAWLHQTGHKGFLGEFGVGRSDACLQDLDRVVSYLAANADVWTGWTYWAAGPLWGEYMYTLEPKNGTDRPQMTVLQKYLSGR
ncbi:glycoside hydrolase family 5 protein [Gluconacetobacter tumulisoli]|uniref:Glycoside hydrolase family 5 protein n=1 Tax=Gluconacetobacter tumulisoli TaxID=1286189 RepID=A0A7W4K5U8_9PROT|nr:glycoside hydrolase family 5 protein [Gluconacetobacter tumulisoli]MBB2200960.1 glycoside hydrolase family 5 protein [Gluconacetobacter tumulisoli]